MDLQNLIASMPPVRGRTVLKLAIASTVSLCLGLGVAFVSPVHEWVKDRFSGPGSVSLSTAERHGAIAGIEYHFETQGGKWRLWHAPPCPANARDTNCYADLIVSQNAPIRWITALIVFCLSMLGFGFFSILHSGRSGVLSAKKLSIEVVNTYDAIAKQEIHRTERTYERLTSVGHTLAVPIEVDLEIPASRSKMEITRVYAEEFDRMARAAQANPQVAAPMLGQAARMMQHLQVSDGPKIIEEPTAHCESCPAMKLLPETAGPARYSAKLTFPITTKKPVAKVQVTYTTAYTYAIDLATQQARYDKSKVTDFMEWVSPGDFDELAIMMTWSKDYKLGEPWVQVSMNEAADPEVIPGRDDPRLVINHAKANGQKTWTLKLKDVRYGQVVRFVWPLT